LIGKQLFHSLSYFSGRLTSNKVDNQNMQSNYDIIVIGAGHAGCEAALASARMGCKVALLTIDLDKIAAMPCSPSIGGMAKGQLVREIDALGGEMAKITDSSAIQYRTLNTRKGKAVHSSRTQNDKIKYHIAMKKVLEKQGRLYLKQALVEKLWIEDQKVKGVIDQTGFVYASDAVILANGTFLKGLVHIGHIAIPAGRAGEFPSIGLADQLAELHLDLGRFKTGTPPRLLKSSIDFSCFEEQKPEPPQRLFSIFSDKASLPQQSCFMGYTNLNSHTIILDNLKQSALHSGRIKGRPARYCPSLEDKIVRFSDKNRHQIILEPEGLETQEIYASGLGNSLPLEIQLQLVRSVEGLAEAEIMRPAYAIEYDYVNPQQLYPTLESRMIDGLYLAGQINGTSGYEEAAAQGLWAGINAAAKIQNKPPMILDRSEAYMGVLIDDLITKGTKEPYRMFTSRAEYRLMLREDNADLRLMKKGHEYGLIHSHVFQDMMDRKKQIKNEIQRIKSITVKPSIELNAFLKSKNSPTIDNGVSLAQLLKRAEIQYDIVQTFEQPLPPVSPLVAEQVEIEIKYEGYIHKQLREIQKFDELERIKIPQTFDFNHVHGLSNELKEKLSNIRPLSLGQASRIEGMTPAALSAIMITLKTAVKNNQVD
jgi:tRNA uridine 5-carboxymethylaminomethyl modification enzyme